MRSRLLLLVFDGEGKFALDAVFLFLEEPMEITVRRSL